MGIDSESEATEFETDTSPSSDDDEKKDTAEDEPMTSSK